MATEPGRRYDLPVSGMSCAACAVRLEKVLNRLPGVAAQVNFATGKARLTAAPDAAIYHRVIAVGSGQIVGRGHDSLLKR